MGSCHHPSNRKMALYLSLEEDFLMNKDQFCQIVITAGLLRDLGRDDSHFAAYSSEFDDGVLRYARELYVEGDQAMKTAEADARLTLTRYWHDSALDSRNVTTE